jgi:hypothetical protein
MAEALKIIVARDGWKGLRRGMSARVVTFAPSTAISWASYEFFSKCLGLVLVGRLAIRRVLMADI